MKHTMRDYSRPLALPIILALGLGLAACANTEQAAAERDAAHMQTLRVDVLGANGQAIQGLACRLSNKHGYFLLQSGGSVAVKRADGDLEIDCDAPAGLNTRAQLRPRASVIAGSKPVANTGSSPSVYGNIGLGGGGSHSWGGISIGFPISVGGGNSPQAKDTITSTWRYPEWVQLRQGKTLLFDAQGSSPNQPALGYEAVAKSGG